MDVFLLGTNQLFCLCSCYLGFPWITSVSRSILNFSTDTFTSTCKSHLLYITLVGFLAPCGLNFLSLTVWFLSIFSLSLYLLSVKEAFVFSLSARLPIKFRDQYETILSYPKSKYAISNILLSVFSFCFSTDLGYTSRAYFNRSSCVEHIASG